MAQGFDPVFGQWYTEKQIGVGSDGKVYSIVKQDENGKTQRSVLKILRISENRSESRDYNAVGDVQSAQPGSFARQVISNIVENIEVIKKADNGKHFVKYEQCAVRKTADNKDFMVLIRMQHLRSLASLLEDISFTLEEAVRLGVSVCRSLIRCRDFQYIYPNLKPENILFDENGCCKLGDFGSFSCLEPAKTSVAFKRTEYYMAPEFIESGKINCTCDTYALGLILYSLVNRGRLPFVQAYADTPAVSELNDSKLRRLAGERLEKPELCSDELFEVISKACAFEQSERYLTPRQMLDDLLAVMNSEPRAKAVYDDIYSSSEKAAMYETVKPSEEAEESNEIDSGDRFSFSAEQIQIPNVTPSEYGAQVKKKQQKRRRSYERLPQLTGKGQKKTGGKGTSRLVLLVIAALAILLLLAVSLKLNLSSAQPALVSSGALLAVEQFYEKGLTAWLLSL